MEKTLNFIKKSNQVLFFLAVVLIIVLVSEELISNLLKNDYEPPKIEIVDSSTQKDIVRKPVYSVDFLTRIKDSHIFQVSAKVIDTDHYHDTIAIKNGSYDLSGEYYLSQNAVNLMFVKENEKQAMLLKTDVLIADFVKAKFPSNNTTYKLDKNLYLIIDQDTNDDGFLDRKDSAKLFTSTYDGKNLNLVLPDVSSFKLINDNKLMIAKKGDSPSFYTFNVADAKLVRLNTSIKVANKE